MFPQKGVVGEQGNEETDDANTTKTETLFYIHPRLSTVDSQRKGRWTMNSLDLIRLNRFVQLQGVSLKRGFYTGFLQQYISWFTLTRDMQVEHCCAAYRYNEKNSGKNFDAVETESFTIIECFNRTLFLYVSEHAVMPFAVTASCGTSRWLLDVTTPSCPSPSPSQYLFFVECVPPLWAAASSRADFFRF